MYRQAVILAIVVMTAVPSTGGAQEQHQEPRQERPTPLPEIVVGGERKAQSEIDRCVEVQIGSNKAFDCINQKLKQDVDRVNPTVNAPPIDARSPDTKTGVVNIPAVQQQYGRNFGISAQPYRPPAPTYTVPTGRR